MLSELNRNNDLTHFKINFKQSVSIDHKKIRSRSGITCSLKRGTDEVISIFPSSSFNIKYHTEYGDKPLSKFLLSLDINWENVDNIEFKKKIGLDDIKHIKPFYWIMEFPDVFFRKPNFKGFDIIIGNPPFIRADTEDELFLIQRNLLEQLPSYENLWEKWDIFVAFIERSIKYLLKNEGYFGFVVSDAICTVKYSQKIRDWIQQNYKIPFLDYFEDFGVFRGIGINPILLFVNKSKNITETVKMIHSGSFKNISKSYNTDQNSKFLWKKIIPEILSYNLGKTERFLDFNEIICNHSLVVFKRFSDLNGVENNSIKNSLRKNNINITRHQLEEISNKYTYEYLLAIMNSKFSNKNLNAIRRHKLENFFYPNDFRNLPIKFLKNQTFFVEIVNILHFLYQSDGNKEIVKFFDDDLLNFIVYEIYFEDQLKKESLYQDLLNFVKIGFKNIDFETWIKLRFRHELKDNEKKQLTTLEDSFNKIIKEIYDKLNKIVINQKIESMKQLDWIAKIEK